MPREDTHSGRWTERKDPDGSRVFKGQASGDDGKIWFLANGKVAVGVSGKAFESQKRKIISRFKVDPVLLDDLEAAFQPPFDGRLFELLQGITQLIDQAQSADQVRFEKHIDTLVSMLRASRDLRLRRFETGTGRRFVDAVHALAKELGRPPTKAEITERLCCDHSQTSKWCSEHGFAWLPNAPAGRRKLL